MVGVPRHRTKPYAMGDTSQGTRYYQDFYPDGTPKTSYSGPILSPVFGLGLKACDDFLTVSGPREPYDLYISSKGGYPSTITGITYRNYGTYYRLFFETGYWSFDALARFTSLPVLEDLAYWQNAIIKNLSVNRPTVDLPLFIFELREFPRLLRDFIAFKRGYNVADVPHSFLSYNFGWAPLFRDMMSLAALQESMHARLTYLLSIRSGQRYSRALKKGDPVLNWTSLQSRTHYKFYRDEYTTQKVWYTARVGVVNESVIESLSSLYRRGLQGEAKALWKIRRKMLGLEASRRSVVTLWNAIPWSWLIDYFANISSFLEASTGVLPFEVKDVCIMRKTTLKWVERDHVHIAPYEPYGNVSFREGLYQRTYKERFVPVSLTPVLAPRPFLTGRQTGILGALLLAEYFRVRKRPYNSYYGSQWPINTLPTVK